MTHRYTIGGIRFTTDRHLPDLPERGFSDLDFTVAFTEGPSSASERSAKHPNSPPNREVAATKDLPEWVEEIDSKAQELSSPSGGGVAEGDGGGQAAPGERIDPPQPLQNDEAALNNRTGDTQPPYRRVSGPGAVSGMFNERTNHLILTDRADPAKNAWLLRQMAPIVSSMSGRLVLHAGAVEIDGGVVAFVGASGAGKSTMARFLTDRGHRFVTDDLLPIRFDPEPSVPADGHLHPLAMIVFLDRTDTDTVIARQLTGVDALQSLVLHGFGEHGDAGSWGFQFDAYHRLAESTPAFDLTVPDDLDSLPLVERALAGLVRGTHKPGPVS